MPNFAVSTKFTADDRLSKAFNRMERNSKRFGARAEKAFQRASRAARGFGGVTKGILAAGAIQRGLGLVEQGMSGVVSQFVEFDDVMTAAAVRFKDIGPDAVNFRERLDEIKAAAREAGANTIYNAVQSGKGLDFFARAGWTAAEGISGLRDVINLTMASGEDFEGVADKASDLLDALAMSGQNSADKIKNFSRLTNVMAKAVNAANVKVEDIFETLKKVGPIAAGTLKVSLEDLMSQVLTLGSSGIKGTLGMTALANSYQNLANPVGGGRKLLEKYNISLKDNAGEARMLSAVLVDLNKALGNVGSVERLAVFSEIFGKQAVAGASGLSQNIAKMADFNQTLVQTGNFGQKVANVMSQSYGNLLKALQSAATEKGFQLLGASMEEQKRTIIALTQAVREFDVTPLIEGIKLVVKSLSVAKGVAGELWDVFLIGIHNTDFSPIEPAIVRVSTAIQDLTRNIFGFDSAREQAVSNFNFQWIVDIVEGAVDIVSNLIERFNAIGEQTGMFESLRDIWGMMKDAFFEALSVIKDVWKWLDDIGVIDTFIASFSMAINIISAFGKIVKLMWQGVKPIFELLGGLLKTILTPLVKTFNALIKGVGILFNLLGKGADMAMANLEKTKPPDVTQIVKQQVEPPRPPGLAAAQTPQEDLLGGFFDYKAYARTPQERRERQSRRVNPQQSLTELETRNRFQGELDVNFNNPPSNTTAEQKTIGAPAIDINLHGINP